MPIQDAADAPLLFAYGTLLDPGVQERVIGRRVEGKPDLLEGYRLTSVEDDGETFPNIAGASDEGVPGCILAVTADELARIDRYEGSLYVRERVRLASGVCAWVYIAPGGGGEFA